jgi:hypothetical protein
MLDFMYTSRGWLMAGGISVLFRGDEGCPDPVDGFAS